MAPPSAVAAARGAKSVGIWLLVVAAFVAAMVTVGGLTRLTGSGLSITEWHPVTGVVPPLSEGVWQSEFAKYQLIPQYIHENPHMTLADFKAIYWWEWSHRLLGRLVGFVFFVPFVAFVAMGAIQRSDYARMLGLFALGGLQGLVGWWMVQSGLETRVSVSQYRLAIHLGVAIILLGALLWAALDYLRSPSVARYARDTSPINGGGKLATDRKPFPPPLAGEVARAQHVTEGGLRTWSLAFVALVYVQMLLGALVAGLHAGLIYNTWPSMNGRFTPENPFYFHPWWSNFGEDAGLAQFDHRIGAYLVALAAMALWTVSRRANAAARLSADFVLGVTAFQVLLGIFTLLNQAPLGLAVLHQATAVALFASAVWHAHMLRRAAIPLPAPVPDRR